LLPRVYVPQPETEKEVAKGKKTTADEHNMTFGFRKYAVEWDSAEAQSEESVPKKAGPTHTKEKQCLSVS
jgi:hypothetical protein